MTTYLERPRKGGGWEASLDGGKTWNRLMPCDMTADNAQKCFDRAKTQTRRLATKCKADGALMARYKVGDIIWLREPWRTPDILDKRKPIDLPSVVCGVPLSVEYEGCCASKLWPIGSKYRGKLRPARFMPLRFARPARYQVQGVRLEQVNAISRTDVLAEGVILNHPLTAFTGQTEARDRFRELWNSIHTKPGTRFEDGPWVWAYTFRRIV